MQLLKLIALTTVDRATANDVVSFLSVGLSLGFLVIMTITIPSAQSARSSRCR